MKKTSQQLAAYVGGELRGRADVLLESVASLKNAGPADLTYAEEKFHDDAKASHAGCIFVKSGEFPQQTVVIVANPKLAFARAAALLYETENSDTFIHPTAVVEPGVSVGHGSSIGPGCTIGSRVRIGEKCTLHPRVTIYPDVEIGNNVIIHAGAVIGSDGFGMAEEGGRWIKIPQVGRVVIGADCEIGANTTIDRGAIDDTVIEDDVKLDNQIQIGHNCVIGAHTAIAGCVGIAGSTRIGRNCKIGGAAMISGHLNIADNTVVSGSTGVFHSIDTAGVYTGAFPALPHREWQHVMSVTRRLRTLEARINALERSTGDAEPTQGEDSP